MTAIEYTEESFTPQPRLIYTATAPDTTIMRAVVRDGIATFTVGGGTIAVTVEVLPIFAALVATVHTTTYSRISP